LQDALVQHALKLMYRVAVQSQWVDTCEAQKIAVDVRSFQVDLAASAASPATPVVTAATAASPVEQVPSNLLQGELVDIFTDARIFIVVSSEQ
jgi:hypothetical protein